MTVELDIYSGRPNPVWKLSDKEQKEFLRRMQALNAATGGVIPDALGYRGIIVRLDEAESAVVCDGMAERRSGLRRVMLSDTGRSLERWLLETSEGRIPEQDRSIALAELDR